MGELNQDKIDKVIADIKPVKVMLDKERHLIFDDRALQVFQFTGGDLEKFVNMEQITLYDLVSIIRASLAHEDKNLTIEGTMRIITVVNAPHVFDAAIRCLQNTQAKLEKKYKQMLKKGDK